MPALIEPTDDTKIQVAKILGLKHLDEVDSLPGEVIDYVDRHWSASREEVLAYYAELMGGEYVESK